MHSSREMKLEAAARKPATLVRAPYASLPPSN